MKKILISIILLFTSVFFYAQNTGPSTEQNYIQIRNYLEPVTASSSTAKQVETVKYFDGLGRPKQIVNVKASPQGKDVVSHIEYDGFGRQVKDYLPVPQQGTQNGAIYTSPLSNAMQPELYGSEKIYAEKSFENSPLDRIMQQKQVGTAWDNKPVSFGYDANTIDDAVKKYGVVTIWENEATKSEISQSINYENAQLYKNIIIDEDGNKTIEFKNDGGQVLLVRKVLSATENADTYYVYNEYNQLAFVIPPTAAIVADPGTVLNDLCYQYRYDGRNRLVEKKLPGKGWEYMIYDKADRLVMSQDANLKEQGKWLFTKHDKFSRVLYTGIVIDAGARNVIQSHFEAVFGVNHETEGSFQHGGITIYYGKTAAPTVFDKVLTVNYYDTYPPYDFNPPFPGTVLGQDVLPATPGTDGLSTKGLPVMSFVKNIEDDNWTKNYTWYDKKGRGVSTYSINHLGGRTWTESKLDFAGMVKQTVTRHKRLDTDTDRVITENFTYDHQNRLLTHTHQVDNNPVEYLAQNTYNELSQLKSKKVGGISPSAPLQQVDYLYNIRGWMTKINDPKNLGGKLFGYEIKYNNPENPTIAPGRFNGNIAEVDWNNGFENVLKRYNYQYDKLNRLTNAFYKEPTTGNSNYFDEYLTYDLNGNIKTLQRTAVPVSGTSETLIDNLEYKYTGNRLNQVIEHTPNPTGYEGGNNMIDYDLNGNMTNMKDKGIYAIGYNHLSLPDNFGISQANPSNGNSANFTLEYLYRADGTKVRKTYSSGGGKGNPVTTNITDYLDGFQYKYSGISTCIWCRTSVAYEQQAFKDPTLEPVFPGTLEPAWILDFVGTAEGFYSFAENRYIYQYLDHLGNARVSYAKNLDGVLQIIDFNNYYAFGMNHIGGLKSKLGGYQNYKYNGKEIQESGMYDYGARFYMPDIGRWGVVDPLAETSRRWSTYNYAYNNPIRFIDPDGRTGKDWVHNRESNSVYWNPNATSQATAGANETYLGTSGTYTTENGSTTALNSDGSHTNNSLMGGLGVMNNLDPLIQAGDSAPLLSMATFGTAGDGSYIRETPSLNTAEGAFANPASQLASTTFTAMQQAPLAVAPELLLAKYLRSGSVIIGNGGNYVSSMNVVREIYKGEKIADLVSSLQARTLSTGVEHAIVKLGPNSAAPGARVIVSGGPHGISFAPGEVSTIFGHTHPFVTGPSAADFQALKILNQSRQYIVEGFNPPIMIRKP